MVSFLSYKLMIEWSLLMLLHLSLMHILFFVGIRGFFANHPAHSCKDIRNSGDSKGDGEYWIDPEKSGNPLNAFCDMTTDGGKQMIMI